MNETTIPLSSLLGPGSQPVESGPECLDMPTDMQVYHQPHLRDADPRATRRACELLRSLSERMRDSGFTTSPPLCIDLRDEEPATIAAVSDALGEGEVAAILKHDDGETNIQETAFAGVWHVLRHDGQGRLVENLIEACAVPPRVIEAARDGTRETLQLPPTPAGVMNSPAVLTELESVSREAAGGAVAHVINLTLLPLTPEDVTHIGTALGAGSATLLSRGYGKCRITSTALRDTWWVQYFNGMDKLILNTIEVIGIPEVALAAPEDWTDSLERMEDLITVLSESGDAS